MPSCLVAPSKAVPVLWVTGFNYHLPTMWTGLKTVHLGIDPPVHCQAPWKCL